MANANAFRESLVDLHTLREKVIQQSKVSDQDWSHYAALVSQICKIEGCCVVKLDAQQNPFVKAASLDPSLISTFICSAEFAVFRARADEKGYATRPANPLATIPLGMALIPGIGHEPFYLLLIIPDDAHSRLQDILLRAQLLLDFGSVQGQLISNKASGSNVVAETPLTSPPNTSSVLHLLDLLNDVYQSEHFLTACYAIVNGIVSHSQHIDQVVLGWREGSYVRVKTISHYERFEKKTDTVRLFEAALEESADQYTDIVFNHDSHTDASDLITLAHKQLQVHLSSKSIITIPLKDDEGETLLVISLISYVEAPIKQECEAIHFICQTALPKLQALYISDSSIWVRTREFLTRSIGKLVGPDNLLIKSLSLAVSLLLIASLVFTTMHRVEGQGRFVTDNTRILSAPFDGIVTEVFFSSGDEVNEGDLILSLDTQELMLQLAELQAELQRVIAEANKARAEFASIDLEIANARVEQMRARIQRINFQLEQARLYAPFDGIVVEGERRELLSAPVQSGQPLMRVAELSDLYVSIKISHEDIHYIARGSEGFFVLVSEPDRRIPIHVTHLVPMADVSPSGAEFRVIARLQEESMTWWRPGMTGVAKLDVEPRSYLWVFTHKAINRIRLALWW
ncbi:MAG: HlyD family efflux transporter periplasmic adaptor subunit [Oceanospirillales bacterium]|nr:MAG: HlyD family efflux transporter periplasmic adaptor subunit [Oceanospirillales bacterium]